MSLFTDGPPSTIEDMSAQDSQLQDMANIEGIDVTQKLRLSWEELGLELATQLNLFVPAGQAFSQAQSDLTHVVVTAPLKLWHTYRTLEMVYDDAYNSQLNDRYANKRNKYHEQAKRAKETLMGSGIGIAWIPVPRAAKPDVQEVVTEEPPPPNEIFYVAMSWVNDKGEEGAASDPMDMAAGGNTFSVAARTAPASAVSWNVYVGVDPNGLVLQNVEPMPASQIWVQPAELKEEGRGPGIGQAANYLKVVPRAIKRG